MAGNASRENGKLGGRQKGRKNDVTLEKEAAHKLFVDEVRRRILPLLDAQMNLARGVSYMYRIDEGPKGGRDYVMVKDPDEIGDILAQMHQQGIESGGFNDKYYYITTSAPDNKAIDSLLDRAIDKATQKTEVRGTLKISDVLDSLEHGQQTKQ
jgi:hypothetical protein